MKGAALLVVAVAMAGHAEPREQRPVWIAALVDRSSDRTSFWTDSP